MNIIQELEKEQVAKLSAGKDIPDFGPGDTVIVNVKVKEGERTRVQAYEGVCIGRSGFLRNPYADCIQHLPHCDTVDANAKYVDGVRAR